MACGKTAAEADLGMHSCDKTDDGGIPASLLYGKSALEFLEQCVSYRKEQEKTR